ncbi:hypothetical protein FO519_007297 [Halicephalobus sp. NKZ332]|nr:hypothetical protein FO519_007297 [Halicephalobus sp. NKZ332]
MHGFAPSDTDTYPVVVKAMKIHEKPIVGLRMFFDSLSGKHILVSAANDSVKLFTAVPFGDEIQLKETGEYAKHRTGAQSFDLHPEGNYLLVSDAMNILHVIERDRLGEMTGKTIDRGIMGILYARFVPNSKTVFTTSFIDGLQTFNLNGENISRYPYDKVKNVSSVNFSPGGKYLAIGHDSGAVDVFKNESFTYLYSVEEIHSKKIRVVEFTHDELQLLVGSDDKTLSLHALLDDSASVVRKYSYHTGFVLAASFDYGTESSMFVSASSDQQVILWDTNSGNAIQVFQNCFKEQVITSVHFSNNGNYLLSGTANGELVIHRISERFEEPELIEEAVDSGAEDLAINEEVADAVPDVSESESEASAKEVNGYHQTPTSPVEEMNIEEDNQGDGTPLEELSTVISETQEIHQSEREGPHTPEEPPEDQSPFEEYVPKTPQTPTEGYPDELSSSQQNTLENVESAASPDPMGEPMEEDHSGTTSKED